ncbi:MAG: hypothetical protein P8178_15885 [Candidatus Thiodiazotropha sp.]
MSLFWGAAVAGDMTHDQGMSGDKMMEHSDKTMEMDKTDSMKSEGEMKTETGDMKAMEADMNTKKMDNMEMNKESDGMQDGMEK